MRTIGIVVVSMLIGIPAILWHGYVLQLCWSWLLVPVFSFEPITLVQALGISLMVGYLTFQMPESSKEEEVGLTLTKAAVFGILKPAVVLGFAWVLTQFM